MSSTESSQRQVRIRFTFSAVLKSTPSSKYLVHPRALGVSVVHCLFEVDFPTQVYTVIFEFSYYSNTALDSKPLFAA